MGWLKPDVEKMEAEKDVKRLLRTLKYDDDDDVRHRAAEALKKISRGENVEMSGKISESEEMKRAEGTINPQLMALIAGIGLVVIQIAALGILNFYNLIFSVSLYFFTSLILGYLWPKFYKGFGVLVLLPSIILLWGFLLFNYPSSQSAEDGKVYVFSFLILSFLLFFITLFGTYIGFLISVLRSEGYSVRKRKKGWIQTSLIIVFMFILIWSLFRYLLGY